MWVTIFHAKVNKKLASLWTTLSTFVDFSLADELRQLLDLKPNLVADQESLAKA